MALELGCTAMVQGKNLVLALDGIQWYSRNKCTPLRHAQLSIRTRTIRTSTFYQATKLQLKHLENTESPQNWSGTAINPSHNWQGHKGMVSNEMADQLARKGSEHLFIQPEPACGISIGAAKKAVRDWMKSQKILGIHNWTETGKGTYTRSLCQKNKGYVAIRDQLRWVIFTGHCHLKGQPFKLGLTGDPTCERCLEDNE
jgi:hypothetical protein